MPEERWEHSGKWLFPARLYIRMGNGWKKNVCVCVCVSPSVGRLGDQLRANVDHYCYYQRTRLHMEYIRFLLREGITHVLLYKLQQRLSG